MLRLKCCNNAEDANSFELLQDLREDNFMVVGCNKGDERISYCDGESNFYEAHSSSSFSLGSIVNDRRCDCGLRVILWTLSIRKQIKKVS